MKFTQSPTQICTGGKRLARNVPSIKGIRMSGAITPLLIHLLIAFNWPEEYLQCYIQKDFTKILICVLCDEVITRPEESYRLWCVVVCDLETSRMRRSWPALGRNATAKKKKIYIWQALLGTVIISERITLLSDWWSCLRNFSLSKTEEINTLQTYLSTTLLVKFA